MGQPVVHWEIAAKDGPALAKFYADVFGWGYKDMDPSYTLMDTRSGGTGISGGIMQTNEQMGNMTGVTFYIETDDIPGYLAKIEKAGGSIIMPESPIPEVGSFGMFKDPEGHVLGLYKPIRPYDPSELGGSKGDGCPVVHWELWSNDEKKTAEFFATVFDWKARTFYPGYEYLDTQTKVGIMGGVMKTQDGGQQWGTGLYIEVPDIAAYHAKIIAAGGKTIVPIMPIEGAGHFGLFADPEGNCMGIYKSDPAMQQKAKEAAASAM